MRDSYGNDMKAFIVSGRSEPEANPDYSKITLTILLKSRIETRKMEVVRSVRGEEPLVDGFKNDFGEKARIAEEAVRKLAKKDPSAGELFLREALEAYGAGTRLRPSQIEEAILGVYLVGEVSRL